MSNRNRKLTSQSIRKYGTPTEATRGNGAVGDKRSEIEVLADRTKHNAQAAGLVVCRCALVLSNGQTVRPLCPFAPWVCEGYPKRTH
jgi:hypothetical protein